MHRRPRLNVFGRQLIVERLESGRSASVVAEELGVSRATVYKWWRRFRSEGGQGLLDRSSRPNRSPRRLDPAVEMAIVELRRARKIGPHRPAALTGRPRSTCYLVLRRHHLHRLDWLDRPTARLVRRYERARPGELVHIDVKKLGRIPEGGGHRGYGRDRRRPTGKRGLGYEFVHSLVDDYSRLAYSEVLADEQGPTCAAFVRPACAFLSQHGVRVERVMTDNAFNYRYSRDFQAALSDLGAKHLRIPFYRPQVNGKVERFNRTLLQEWAYVRPYGSNQERLSSLTTWLHSYNWHRSHAALGGRPPIERVNNLSGNYS
jgi:transposase InsO family protein